MARKCLFLADLTQANGFVADTSAGKGGFLVVAAAKSVETRLIAAGIDCVSPGGLCSESAQLAALQQITGLVGAVTACLEAHRLRPGRVAFIGQELLFSLSQYQNRTMIAEALDAEPHVLAGGKPVPMGFPALPERQPPGGSQIRNAARPPFLPFVNPFGAPFLFDMRANKARTPPQPGLPRHVRLSAIANRPWASILARNVAQSLRGWFDPASALRAALLPGTRPVDPAIVKALEAALGPLLDEPELAHAIASHVGKLLAALESHRQAIDRMLARRGKNLKLVAVDSPANILEVALCEASADLSVPVVEESHGSVVVHGDSAREAAAKILAGGGYNWSPDATWLVSRSPLQLTNAPQDKKILRVNHVVGLPKNSPGNRPFTILFAPNFLRWSLSIPAFAATCFDTFAIARHLVATVAPHADWHMQMRVKVTTSDQPSGRDMQVDRGLVPTDLAPFFKVSPNVTDASAQSWSALIANCDLVITEGMTLVMFEALEHRKPVLLMNLAAARTPSLPAHRLAHLRKTQGRFAVYASSCEEDTGALIGLIQQRHQHQPLHDGELDGLCWVNVPRTRQHYLHAVLAKIRKNR